MFLAQVKYCVVLRGPKFVSQDRLPKVLIAFLQPVRDEDQVVPSATMGTLPAIVHPAIMETVIWADAAVIRMCPTCPPFQIVRTPTAKSPQYMMLMSEKSLKTNRYRILLSLISV